MFANPIGAVLVILYRNVISKDINNLNLFFFLWLKICVHFLFTVTVKYNFKKPQYEYLAKQ